MYWKIIILLELVYISEERTHFQSEIYLINEEFTEK